MPEKEVHRHVAELIRTARLKKGFATLKEMYRKTKPSVDYQTWLHAEAGRRTPHPDSLLEIGKILDIERDELIVAYCKDKFPDSESRGVIDSFACNRFIDLDTLIDGKHHDDYLTYTYNEKQMAAIKEDPRIRLFLIYTYDKDLKTTFSRLSRFFKVEKAEAKKIMETAESIGLVTINGEEVTRAHRYTSLPVTDDYLNLRVAMLVKELENNISNDSYFSNIHTILSDESFRKILAYLFFAEAKIVKLAKEERLDRKTSRIQISFIANKIDEDFSDETS